MTQLKTAVLRIHLPQELHDDMERESRRLDRSMAWLIKRAWHHAAENIKQIPAYEAHHHDT